MPLSLPKRLGDYQGQTTGQSSEDLEWSWWCEALGKAFVVLVLLQPFSRLGASDSGRVHMCLKFIPSDCILLLKYKNTCLRLEGKERSRELHVSKLQGFGCFHHLFLCPAACSILSSLCLYCLIRLKTDIYIYTCMFCTLHELNIYLCIYILKHEKHLPPHFGKMRKGEEGRSVSSRRLCHAPLCSAVPPHAACLWGLGAPLQLLQIFWLWVWELGLKGLIAHQGAASPTDMVSSWYLEPPSSCRTGCILAGIPESRMGGRLLTFGTGQWSLGWSTACFPIGIKRQIWIHSRKNSRITAFNQSESICLLSTAGIPHFCFAYWFL